MSGKGKPVNPQKRLLTPPTDPAQVITTPTGKVRLSDIQLDGELVGNVLTVTEEGVRAEEATGGETDYQHIDDDATITLIRHETIIGVDTSTNAVEITLPNPSTITAGWRVLVRDETGNAAANNITLAVAVGSIGKAAISTAEAWVQFYCDGSANWFVCAGGDPTTVPA